MVWGLLRRISNYFDFPWFILGDLNEIISTSEKSCGREAFVRFEEWINDEGLIDMGFVGLKFT